MDQAGEYYCRASNENGAIKSKPATLSVIGEPVTDKHLPFVYHGFVHLGNFFQSKKVKRRHPATRILNRT